MRFPLLQALVLAGSCAMNPSALAQSSPCDSILRDGTMAKADYRGRQELRRILHWKFASQEMKSSQRDTSFGADIPIYETLVGVDFSEKEASESRKAIRESLDMDFIQNYTLSYMLTSGDAVIANAWTSCMRTKGGFYVWFAQRQGDVAPVHIEFHSPKDRDQGFQISDVQWTFIDLEGRKSRIDPGAHDCLKSGKTYNSGDSCVVALENAPSDTGVLMVVNGRYTSSGGATDGATAFLPPNLRWVGRTDRVVSTQLDPPKITSHTANYWNPGAYNLPEVCIDRSEVGGPLFIRSTARAVSSPHCTGSDGACTGSVTAVTDEKFCWSGRMVVDRQGNSCTCTVHGTIDVMRSRWVPAGLAAEPQK